MGTRFVNLFIGKENMFKTLIINIFIINFALAQPSQKLAIQCAETTLEFINFQPYRSPTFISRALAYTGIAQYESIVHADPKYATLAPYLNGLKPLPKPIKGQTYDWDLAMTTAVCQINRLLWSSNKNGYGEYLEKKLEFFENTQLSKKTHLDTSIVNRSVSFGASIAQHIFEWSKTDGGHEKNFELFDEKYTYPTDIKQGFWKPPLKGQSPILMPMHPYWGQNRTFSKLNGTIKVPKFLKFSTDSTAEYFKQHKEVYEIQKNLTQKQKEIANWWGDDPAFSAAPPGHAYHLVTLLLEKYPKGSIDASLVYAAVGMATADAFINCWKAKYTYHSERPSNFINLNIDKDFVQYWPEPPFPGFPSGHSTQIAAAVTVLEEAFPGATDIVDDTHAAWPRDPMRNVDYKKRTYNTLGEIALECGISRLYGGIHTRIDNEVGLDQGKKIGQNICKTLKVGLKMLEK